MKKKLKFYILIGFLLSCFSHAQTTIFNSNFANSIGNNNWTLDANWINSSSNSFAGAGNYLHTLQNGANNYNINVNNNRATSPTINLTGYERLTVEFRLYLKTSTAAGDLDRLSLEYETNNIPTIANGNSNALTWFTLGRLQSQEVLSNNWYNSTMLLPAATLPTFYWKQNNGGWLDCKMELPAQAFDNKPAVRFRFNFSSDGNGSVGNGVAVDDFVVKGYLTTPKTYLTASCSPTLFNNLEGWWKADALSGTFTHGQAIPNWTNSANILNNWTDLKNANVANQPVYIDTPAENINFNPVVKFDGINDFLMARQGFYNDEIFIVIKTADPIQKGTARVDVIMGEDYTRDGGNQDVTGISVNETSSRYTPNNDFAAYNQGPRDNYGKALLHPTLAYDRPVVFNTRINTTNNGQDLLLDAINLAAAPFPPTLSAEVNPTTYHKVTNSKFLLGRSTYFDTSGFLKGNVAEILVFSATKSAADRDIINTYLALKYGANLGLHPNPAAGVPHAPYPYKNSAGQFLFLGQIPGHPDYGFTYNVCAIGRDDCMGLNQKQSYSVDPQTYVTVGLGDIYVKNTLNPNNFTADKDFLIWGSTLEDLASPTTDLAIGLGPAVTTFTSVTNRTWKFKEIKGLPTSDVGTVKLQIETAGLLIPITGPEDAIVMIVSDSPNFDPATDNIETVFMTQNGIYHQCYYDFDGTKFVKFGIAHETLAPFHMDFDGVNDKIQLGNNLNLNANFTISSWVNTSGSNATLSDKTIVSKFNSLTADGYSFSLTDANRVKFISKKAGVTTTIISNTVLPINTWRNVAVTYDGTNLRMYIDGILDRTNALSAPSTSNNIFSVASNYIDKLTILDVFKGKLDELRIYNKALTVTELRFVMNQELEKIGLAIKGKELPLSITKNDISAKVWSDLVLYFNFNSYLGTHINDLSNSRLRGSLIDRTGYLINVQTSPIPYITTNDGNCNLAATWSGGSELYVPGSTLNVNGVNTEVTWNIIRNSRNVVFNNASQSLSVLGLINTANVFSIANDSKLEISHYLKNDGGIDLVGKSQLIQPINSDLDVTSAGFLERDILGQSKRFNYNFISSPVSTLSTVSNNSGYVINSVLKDATVESSLQNITWTNSYDGLPTTPITLSRRWLYAFRNTAGTYSNWVALNENSSLIAGNGFTLKGLKPTNGTQTYTFTGKPNNGTISFPINANNLTLVGNPYPSALDTNAFLTTNASSLVGTVYFWEHSVLNDSHILREYRGGYAARNLTGGVPPVAPVGILDLGGNVKTPNRYIPVGQGFFVTASASGGTITFNNSMRAFVKEDQANSNTLFRQKASNSNLREVDEFKKVRLKVTLPEGNSRELLLGFMNENATNKFDNLYDGEIYDQFESDAGFLLENKKLCILGTGYFDKSNVFDLNIKTKISGVTTIELIDSKNHPSEEPIYLYDKKNNTYTNLIRSSFTNVLENGEYSDRFQLVFEKQAAIDTANDFVVYYNNAAQTLNLFNDVQGTKLVKVEIFDIQGKLLFTHDVSENKASYSFNKAFATGVYLVRITTNNKVQNTKFIAE